MIYLLLGAVGLICFGLALLVDKDPKMVAATAILTGGAISVGDLIFATFLNWYTYVPGLMPQPADHFLGLVLGDKLFVPGVVAAVLPWSARKKGFQSWPLAVGAGLLEVMFFRAGLYRHHRWHVAATVLLFAVYLALTEGILRHFRAVGYTRWYRAALSAAYVCYVFSVWAVVAQILLDLFHLRPHWVPAMMMDRVLGGTVLHGIPFAVIALGAGWFRWNQSAVPLVSIALVFSLWFTLLQALGVWEARSVWTPYYESAVLTLLVYAMGVLDRWFLGESERPAARAET